MSFSELIQRRYSVRAYQSREVPEALLHEVLDAFNFAPTAANRQPIALIVIRTAERRQDLARIYRAEWFHTQAPYVLCACTVADKAWKRSDDKNYADIDVAIALDHLILAATERDLGTCWIGAFDPKAAREVLGLPEGVEPVAFTPLGYPADSPRPKLRKKLEQIVHYDRW